MKTVSLVLKAPPFSFLAQSFKMQSSLQTQTIPLNWSHLSRQLQDFLTQSTKMMRQCQSKQSLMQMTWMHGSMASRRSWSKKQGTRSIQTTLRLTPFAKNITLNASKELQEHQSHLTTTQWSVNSPMPSPPRMKKPSNPTDSVARKLNVSSTRMSQRKTGQKNSHLDDQDDWTSIS